MEFLTEFTKMKEEVNSELRMEFLTEFAKRRKARMMRA